MARAVRDRCLRVVIVDEELPYPADSGKRIRTLGLTLPLARRHRITYLAHCGIDRQADQQAAAFLESQGIESVLVDRRVPAKQGPAFYARLAANLLSPLPYSVQSHASHAMRRAVREYAAGHEVDLWHCEWTPYAHSVRGLVRGPWIVMAHNVESLIWQRYYQTETNPLKRWYIQQQWKKFQRFEQRVFSEAGMVVTVSEPDAVLAKRQFSAAKVGVVDNGVDVAHFRPDAASRDPRQVLFLGSLDWRPNQAAATWLLDEIFPRVLRAEPEARLAIVGRRPPAWLVQRAQGCPNVALHADVSDVRPFLRTSGLLVVPLRIGGGSRLKILEALAAECPVVSTRIGTEGLCLVPGEHYLPADSVEEMAAVMGGAMRDPAPIRRMAALGRQVVLQRYDWSLLADKLEAYWLEQVQMGRRAGRPPVASDRAIASQVDNLVGQVSNLPDSRQVENLPLR